MRRPAFENASDGRSRLIATLALGFGLHAGVVLAAAQGGPRVAEHQAAAVWKETFVDVSMTPEPVREASGKRDVGPARPPSRAATPHAVRTARVVSTPDRQMPAASAPEVMTEPATALVDSQVAAGTASAAPHGATLVAALPCNGFFPYRARGDAAKVEVAVMVDPSGAPAAVHVETESPRGEGFGAAAESCARFARFRPATDVAGRAVASVARLELTFRRHRP